MACTYCQYDLVKKKVQTPENLLASLWKDLAVDNSRLSKVVQDIRDKNEHRQSRPSLKEISDALNDEIQRYNQVFILFDALDECPEEERIREHVVNALLALPANVKLLISSRENIDITSIFSDALPLDIKATDTDVRAYLTGQRHRFNRAVIAGPEGELLEEEITKAIISSASGM